MGNSRAGCGGCRAGHFSYRVNQQPGNDGNPTAGHGRDCTTGGRAADFANSPHNDRGKLCVYAARRYAAQRHRILNRRDHNSSNGTGWRCVELDRYRYRHGDIAVHCARAIAER